MKKPWKNPVDRPAKQSTMDTPGDFGKFTDLMKRVVSVPPQQMKKQPSSSRAPDAS
jgi:hypothetical protein